MNSFDDWGAARSSSGLDNYEADNMELVQAVLEQNEALQHRLKKLSKDCDTRIAGVEEYATKILDKNNKLFEENEQFRVQITELEAHNEFLVEANAVLHETRTDLLNTNISIRDILEMRDPDLLNEFPKEVMLRQRDLSTSISIGDIVTKQTKQQTKQHSEIYKPWPQKDSRQPVKDNTASRLPHDGKSYRKSKE
jgi:hypothetical protein